jgi:branched-chain amino acid transport system ATP-binding protein
MTLHVSNLMAGYGRAHALRGVSLHVGAGQIVALLGANGAGKTTLLRAISGLAAIHAGTITLFGTDTTGYPAEKLVESGLVHVPQGRHLFRDMTVIENLEMGAYLIGGRKVAEERIGEVFNLFPVLRERAKRAASILSGGEQQMLAIGRALMSKPKCLLLDEPSLGLAPKTFALILDVASGINQAGTSILIAEQNAAKVLRLAHYAYVLENGKIAAEGESETLLSSGQIQSSYLGAA